jgi:hypothetical protein
MKTALLALLLLTACGSGGGVAPPADAVTLIALTATTPDGQMGYARWDEHGSSIGILDCPENDITFVRRATLKHELWHLLTHIEDHPNPREACISGSPIVLVPMPCADEIAQANESNRVVTIRFPEDPLCANECADWWNFWLGRDAVLVVD